MTQQTDWIGGDAVASTLSRPMRDTRDSVAERKALLSLRLHSLASYCPQAIRSADAFKTRQWAARQGAARKVAAKARVSVQELETAINSLDAYLDDSERVRFGA